MPAHHDPRIDFFRGLALIFIFINHIPHNFLSWFTSRAAGLSDAAEAFMFLAGYSTALAYARLAGEGLQPMARKAGKRAAEILAYHVALVAIVMLASAVLVRSFGLATGYEIFIERIESAPLGTLIATPLLGFQAPLLDILPLYVVLLLAAPFMLWALARNPLVLLVVSGMVWLFAGRFLPLIPTVTYDVYWAFNPLCWQFLFAIGLVCGWRVREGKLSVSPAEMRWLLDAACAAFSLFSLVVMLSIQFPATFGEGFHEMRMFYWGLNKQCLDVWRIADILTSAYLLSRFVPRTAAWLRTPLPRWIAAAGSRSLQVFSLGVVLSFAGKFLTEAYGGGALADCVVSFAGIAIMLAAGVALAGSRAAPDFTPKSECETLSLVSTNGRR
jgi:hypothetical protein